MQPEPSHSVFRRAMNIARTAAGTAAEHSAAAHRMPAPRRRGEERGFALLIVFWSLVLLALLATQLTAAGRTEAEIAANLRGGAIAEAAADGAVHEALARLLDPSTRQLLADGVVRRTAVPHGIVDVRVQDEGGKINPNTASPALLAALLRALRADPGTASSIAAAMAAWRMPSLGGPGFAPVAAQYRAAGHDYAPPGAPFQSLDEIGLVLGMTPELLARLTPHLSLYTEDSPVPSKADPVVLQALRESTDSLPEAGGAAGADAVLAMSITASAHMAGGANFTRYALVRMAPTTRGRPFQILVWEPAAP